MNKTYKVYKHTSPSNKVYIGITKQDNLNRRWDNGKGYISNKYFYSAIRKYGWDNFKHEILYDNLSQHEAYDKEMELIKKYNSTNPNFGYNISEGGPLIIKKNDKKDLSVNFDMFLQRLIIWYNNLDYIRKIAVLIKGGFISEYEFNKIIVTYDNKNFNNMIFLSILELNQFECGHNCKLKYRKLNSCSELEDSLLFELEQITDIEINDIVKKSFQEYLICENSFI